MAKKFLATIRTHEALSRQEVQEIVDTKFAVSPKVIVRWTSDRILSVNIYTEQETTGEQVHQLAKAIENELGWPVLQIAPFRTPARPKPTMLIADFNRKMSEVCTHDRVLELVDNIVSKKPKNRLQDLVASDLRWLHQNFTCKIESVNVDPSRDHISVEYSDDDQTMEVWIHEHFAKKVVPTIQVVVDLTKSDFCRVIDAVENKVTYEGTIGGAVTEVFNKRVIR